jgi:hypothetical protein
LPFGNAGIRGYVAIDPTAQYIQVAEGARANSGRNTLRTNGFNRTDLVVLKRTGFGTDNQYNFEIGAEVSNLLNQRTRFLGDLVSR